MHSVAIASGCAPASLYSWPLVNQLIMYLVPMVVEVSELSEATNRNSASAGTVPVGLGSKNLGSAQPLLPPPPP